MRAVISEERLAEIRADYHTHECAHKACWDVADLLRDRDALVARVEVLEKALTRISEGCCLTVWGMKICDEPGCRMADEARAALASPSGGGEGEPPLTAQGRFTGIARKGTLPSPQETDDDPA